MAAGPRAKARAAGSLVEVRGRGAVADIRRAHVHRRREPGDRDRVGRASQGEVHLRDRDLGSRVKLKTVWHSQVLKLSKVVRKCLLASLRREGAVLGSRQPGRERAWPEAPSASTASATSAKPTACMVEDSEPALATGDCQ